MNKFLWIVSTVAILIVAAIISIILTFGNEQKEGDALVGVIMPGSVAELGWNRVHYDGIHEAAKELGVKDSLIENVKENSGACAGAIESLIRAGAKIIILGSYNYSVEVSEVIQKHPDVMFFCCAASLKIDNYKVYFARVYQARYLSGIIAGLSTKNNRIGYVAAMNNNEVNRGINAFTLGVRKVNPKAHVYVKWTGSWDDEAIETKNVDALVDSAHVDLVTYHQNQDWVLRESEKRGILSIGYNLNSTSYSEKVLTSVVTNWKMVYKEFMQDYFQKKKSISNYWIGMEKNAVGLSFYSPLVSYSSKTIVDELSSQMQNGMDIFVGPIYDNKHQKRCEKDEIVSDYVLREEMDWFVDGVEIYEE